MARDKNFCEVEALNKLTEVFWQKGYNGTSMDDLLQQSGLSRSSLYATYGDKRSLFLQALKKYVETQNAGTKRRIQQCNSTSEAVDALFCSVINAGINCGAAKGCFLVNTIIEWSTADKEINNIVETYRNTLIQELTKLIKADMQKGIISKNYKPARLASFIYNNLTGIQVAVKAGAVRQELIDIKKIVSGVLTSEII